MSEYARTTVMGPGMGSTPGFDMLMPPRLTATSDKFKWRKRVTLWVTTVKRFAKGGDKRAKGIWNALGLTLFNALDQVFSSQVEQSIAAGMINLDGDENDEDESNNKQLKIVNDIIDLVAKDSPTDGIRRLVQMMREVFGRVRKGGESPALFSRRFQALALDYLNHCDTATIQQDSQNFAMLLLENAKIPASVYSSVITRLVSMISSRSDSTTNKIYVISKERLERIKGKVVAMRALVQDEQMSDTSKEDFEKQSKLILEAIKTTCEANELHVKQDRIIFRITLDDAVEVLKDLKVSDDEDTDTTGNQKNKKLGSLLGKREHQDTEQQNHKQYNHRDKRQKSHIPSGQGPKATSRCRSCKELNHWYRDPECIYNVIKALMEGKEIPADVVQKLSPSVRNLFKDDHGNYKSKIPVNEIIGAMNNSPASVDVKDVSNAKNSNSYFR